MNKGFILLILIVILFGMSGVAKATATYSGETITVRGGSNTLDMIYTDINNPAILSKSGNVYTLTANIKINSDAVLTIEDCTLQINEPSNNYYKIEVEVSGSLNINRATVTSATAYAIKIMVHNAKGIPGKLNMDTVDLSKLGEDTYGGIQLGNYNSDEGIPLTWNNVKFHDNIGDKLIWAGYGGFRVNITNSEFYNLSTSYFPILDATYASIKNSKFHDIKGTLILSWGESAEYTGNEFYNITTGSLIYAKEGQGGVTFSNNHIYNSSIGSLMGFYGSTWTKEVTFKNNLVENITGAGSEFVYWRANQYLGRVSLISDMSNNTFRNVTGSPRFAFHSGGQYCRIYDNVFEGTSTLPNFGANYQKSQAGGGQYHPGDSAGSILYDMVFKDILINDLDDPADQSIHGKLLPFVNVKYNSVKVSMPDDYFYDYKYLNVKVIDANGNPINGAAVTVTNEVDSNYPSINLYRATKTNFVTGADGHIPLPSDALNTAAILDFWKTSTSQQEMTYTITALSSGKSATVTGVAPNENWYRSDPSVPNVTVVLNIDNGTGSTVTPDLGSVTPQITAFSPSNLSLSQDEGTMNTFNVTVDQLVTNRWFLDSVGQSETSQIFTKTWSYSDTGMHTISYTGTNTNGSVSQTWNVTVNDVVQGTSQTNEQKIRVYPNPYIKGKSPIDKITFGNLAKEATIKIYTPDGKLVTEIEHRAAANGGLEEWDVSNINSGIYLYVITSSEGTRRGKVSVIK